MLQRFLESVKFSFVRFILDDYRLDLKDIYYMTPLITIAKNFISQIIVISLADKGMVQVYLVLAVQMSYTVYYMKANPKQEKMNNIMSHITNVCFTIYTALYVLTNTIDFTVKIKQGVFGLIMAIILLIIIGVNLIYILYTVISLLFKLIKGLCQKKDPLREKIYKEVDEIDYSQIGMTRPEADASISGIMENPTDKADQSLEEKDLANHSIEKPNQSIKNPKRSIEKPNESIQNPKLRIEKPTNKENGVNIRTDSIPLENNDCSNLSVWAQRGKRVHKKRILNKYTGKNSNQIADEANKAGASIKKTTIAQISFVHNNGRKANQINEDQDMNQPIGVKLSTPSNLIRESGAIAQSQPREMKRVFPVNKPKKMNIVNPAHPKKNENIEVSNVSYGPVDDEEPYQSENQVEGDCYNIQEKKTLKNLEEQTF